MQLKDIYERYDAPPIQSYQLEITLLHSICVAKSRYDEHRLGCHRYRRLLRVGPFLFKLLSTSKHFQIRGPSSRCRVPASKGGGEGFSTSMLKRAYSVGNYWPKNIIHSYWTHWLALSDRKSLPFVTPLPNQIKLQSVCICQSCYVYFWPIAWQNQTVQLKWICLLDEDTNYVTCGFVLYISCLCVNSQLVSKVTMLANIGEIVWWWNWSLIKGQSTQLPMPVP